MNKKKIPVLFSVICFGFSLRANAQYEEHVTPLLEPYWVRHVEAVQDRKIKKNGALELVGVVGVIPNDSFVVYIPIGIRGAYNFNERYALEVSFEYNLSIDTSLRNSLKDSNSSIWMGEHQGFRASGDFLWSPVYGKLAAGSKVLQIELYFLIGAGVITTLEDKNLGLDASFGPDFNVGAGIRAFFSEWWLLRFEYRQYLYIRPSSSSGLGNGVKLPSEIALCAGVLLGGS